jgi:hypothetical protein
MRETLKVLIDLIDDNRNSDKLLLEHLQDALLRASQLFCGSFVTDRLTNEEIEVGKKQGKIACIKLVRARLYLGLKEAKDLVEAEEKRLGFACQYPQTLYN